MAARHDTGLLSALLEANADVGAELTPHEAGRRLLQLGMTVLGAKSGWAQVNDPLGPPLSVALPEGDASASVSGTAVVSLTLGGAPDGRLALSFERERRLAENEGAFLQVLGGILVHDVERARLRALRREAELDRERKERWARALHDAFRLISSSGSLKYILDELARVSCALPADFCAIRILSEDGEQLEFCGLYHPDPAQSARLHAALDGRVQPAALGGTAQVLATGESLLIAEIDMEQLVRAYAGTPFGDFIKSHRLCTVMVVPVRARGAVLGVVTVARTTPLPFIEPDLRFLEEVADRASTAIDNAMLLQRLTHSEEQLHVALEAGRLGMWNWDINARRVTWSTMLEEIHGLVPGTFAGTVEAFERDIHPEDRARVLAGLAEDVEHHTEHHLTYRIVRPDKEVRWLEAHGRLLRDAAGMPLSLIGVCADVTDRKQADAKLRETLLALRSADQRKDDFLAMLAHELRNPLAPMVNATHLLSTPGVREEVAVRARAILDRQVSHMARLLDDILDVSRITRGKVELRRETFDLGALARETVGDRVELFRAAGLALELTIVEEPLLVDADRARLAQVIGNLLSNAQKFSSAGQSVHVRVEADRSGRAVILGVRDEGVGIDPALLESMFEPFVQADTSLARPKGGLGLGLAVVKGLVVLHGGSVVAASDGPGRGAEIRVELPRQVTGAGVRTKHEATTMSPAVASRKVLVFEDNADAAESLCEVLDGAGYRVWIERTGAHAMEALRRVRPDAVLCDLGLPERDGYTIASEIRADPEWNSLPLIAISGYGATEDHARSRRAGFDLHLTKPVPPRSLVLELARCLADASCRSRASVPHHP